MARRWKGLNRNIDKTRKQGRLPEKYIVIEVDNMPQLKLSWVKSGENEPKKYKDL